ncbi:hypothetical protein RE652_006755 [Acinetobacter baumannii]|uniref:hypothetical protein n=1 Tax=Acinetobacter nosocomialis TaxID=106654 RepID=UPI00028C4627|nr:hypothetical protein [Acinetobacter nosocomialis]EMD7854940.1 hypothetical protein [Acinetobacter baumannii]EKF46189.1 hypothetical protein W9I_03337 [Acinetobacter nosocomialis Ab22222]EKF47549.1 hypothetical protein W9I_00023 [Acinetobacter nosocomialis Ab22222]MDR4102741.1 hypothetical protein [Acinetobacter baumannii]MEB3855820.1 hypothetical protein [Acinetobacter nosocomialis]
MDNYKIKVNDEAESKEAQELFFELGYSWLGCGKYYNRIGNYTFITAYPDEMLLRMGWGGDTDKELTLPQLQDLVVLKRNDVKDATHRDKRDESIYLTSDKVIYYWQGEWCKSAINKSNDYENYIANSLTPITQPQDPALISGADVLRALADGKEVEGFSEENEEWIPIVYFSVQEVVNGLYKFRLKPQTIKVELELPKPFEPEEDCHVYILDDGKTDGYRRYSYEVHGDKGNTFIGIWRTEEEIKQVVEQLRKIRGTN